MNLLDLPGPQSLAFYAVVGAIALWTLYWSRRRDENGRPTSLGVRDPYLIAFLRGGANEALRVATIALIDRGLLVQQMGRLTVNPVGSAARHPVEEAVVEVFSLGAQATAIFGAAPRFRAIWQTYDAELLRAGLLPDDAARARRRRRLASPWRRCSGSPLRSSPWRSAGAARMSTGSSCWPSRSRSSQCGSATLVSRAADVR